MYPFKFDSIIKLQKFKLETDNNKNLIYLIKCKDYVRQTKHLLSTRRDVHQDNIRK